MEEYIREFEQLQMRVGLNEEPELKIARFIKRLSLSIANKVDLQPYLSFDDVCYLAVKVKKQLKGRKSFRTSLTNRTTTHIKIEPYPHKSKLLTRLRELLVSHLKGWKERNILSVIILGIFRLIVIIERPLP